MISNTVPAVTAGPAAASGLPPDRVLMEHALVLYRPDIGLAIHRALEAREVARETPESPVLDLGCSDGRFASLWTALLPRSPRLLGCDLSLAALQQGAAGGSPLFGMASDGRQLPVRDGSVATVVANSVLAHVPELDGLLDEVARVLRPQGRLLASVPGPAFEKQLAWVQICNHLGLRWLARRAGDRYHLRWQQWHRDGKGVWARRLTAHGLSLEGARLYPGERTGFIWSLAFSLIRAGVGRFIALNLLMKIGPGNRRHLAAQPLAGLLARRLAPLLSETEAEGGSIFLVARKVNPPPRATHSARPESPRVPTASDRPNVAATLQWLTKSKIRIAGDDAPIMAGGYGDLIDGRSGRSPRLYCEITGYAAQFWIRQHRDDAVGRALAAGDCLLRVQVPDENDRLSGAFPFGLTRPEGTPVPGYFSFDAGVCAAALADLAVRSGAPRFAEGARRAGLFLRRMQTADGSFAAMQTTHPDHPCLPKPEGWFADRCVLHGKNVIALLKLWGLTGESHWQQTARLTLDWLCGLQGSRGEFPQRAGAPSSMAHTHCYATEGLLYAGLVLGEERYLTAGVRGAEWLRVAQRRDGALYRDYRTADAGMPRPAPPSHLHVGPVGQAARIWWVAAQIAPGRPWTDAAGRALGFLARVQAPAADSWRGGAFPQSARPIGPWLHGHPAYSPWEAMFACEAVRLWTSGTDEPAWSIF